jgi:hypothetical protein
MFNSHLYDKLVQAHTRELLLEAEQERLAIQVSQPRPQLVQKVGGWLAALWMKLPFWGQKMQYSKRPVTGQL